MKIDYLIIGQGLAGSLLAYELIERQKKVLIVDHNHKNSATQVAAGLINPITGKRLVLMPDYNKYLLSAQETYQQIQQDSNSPIFSQTNIVRVFKDAKELQLWNDKRETPESFKHVKKYNPAGLYSEHIHDNYGSLTYQGSLCNTQLLLNSLKNYFQELKILVDEEFTHKELLVSSEKIQWKEYTANKIIFCEGYTANKNPYFEDLPFKHAKGEILHLKLKQDNFPNLIFNAGKWIIPIDQQTIKIGSNYDWNNIDCNPSSSGKDEILNDIKRLLKTDFNIIDHTAGVRPILIDLNPILGLHPKNNQIGIFNGLGSKGTLIAPFWAKHFANHLLEHSPLDSQVNVARFLK